MLAQLAHWCYNKRWVVIGLWLALVVTIGASGGAIGSKFDNKRELPDSDSANGFNVITEKFPALGGGLSGSIVFRAPAGVNDPTVKTEMTKFFDEVSKIEGVTLASPYAEQRGASQINPPGGNEPAGTVAFAQVNLSKDFDQKKGGEVGTKIHDLLPSIDGVDIEVGGSILSVFVPPQSETIGLAFAVVVLILSFGSVLAMGLPIAVALGGVGTGAGLIILMSNLMSMPDFASTLGAMIGLGVGIDYALFIVTRYREGLHAGLTPEQATVRAMDTAGRAVIFAGLTVVVSLLGMVLMGLSFVTGLAVATSITVAATMLASMTLLPALIAFARERVEVTRWRGLLAAGFIALAMLGFGIGFMPLLLGAPLAVIVFALGFAVAPLEQQVPARAPKPRDQTTAYKWSHLVQRHPWISLLSGVALMAILAVPLFDLRLGFSDEGNFPAGTTTRRAYDMVAEGFGPGFNGPLLITVSNSKPGDFPSVIKIQQALTKVDGIASVAQPFPNDLANPTASTDFVLRVIPTTSPQDLATADLVGRLRSDVVPALTAGTDTTIHVAGFPAVAIDFSDYMATRMVLFFGAVLALSFLLLMAVFRSLLVPLKAVIMNVVSIAAAYGIVVAVFQWGWFGSMFNIAGAPIEPFLPMMMFAIVFGLSMDYEVFLLSRVKEEFDRTGDPRNSVADGLAATARVITAAAAIMVVVFGSFMFEDNRILKLFGLGLAVAVFLDATVVRMLMVPATMELLGAKNWWIPKWLDKILPHIDVEGAHIEAPAEVSSAP